MFGFRSKSKEYHQEYISDSDVLKLGFIIVYMFLYQSKVVNLFFQFMDVC